MGDVIELLAADIIEALAAGLELFFDLDGFLGHHLMGFLSAPNEGEVFAGGHAFMSVGIEADAKDCGGALRFRLVGHQERLTLRPHSVKARHITT